MTKFRTPTGSGNYAYHRSFGYVNGRWPLLKKAVSDFVEETGVKEEEVNVLEISGNSSTHNHHTFLSATLPAGAPIPEGYEKEAETFWGYIR